MFPARARRRFRAHRLLPALLAGSLLAVACQPVDTEVAEGEPVDARDTGAPPAAAGTPGAPTSATAAPADLTALLEVQASTAAQWQAGARPVELVASLDDGRWTGTTILYLAPDADRFLLVSADAGGAAQQRPTLATLGLEPVTGPGVEAVPPLPELVLDPVALAAAAAGALAACDAGGDVTSVAYTTGAPATWDGQAWVEPPVWTATVAADDGAGVVVDPVTVQAAGDACVPPAG